MWMVYVNLGQPLEEFSSVLGLAELARLNCILVELTELPNA